MRNTRRIISVAMALMLALSAFCSVSAFADEKSTDRAMGRIYVDNAASGGYALEEQDGVFVSRMAKTVSYPASYSSVDKGYITPVKHQGDYGTCWAHGAAASAEASLIKNNGFSKTTNLSELHLSYYMYNKAFDPLNLLNGDSTVIGSRYARYYSFLDVGGSNSFTPFTLARWTGLVDEGKHTDFAYEKANSYYTVSDTASAYKYDAAHLTEAYWVSPEDKDDMKYMITNYGAGTIAYYHDDYYINDNTNAYYYSGSNYPNHEVTVVGWDDNYSKKNFKKTPSNDGAWLVKNSWGTGWGNNGYFWLSYEDESLCSDVASFYAFESNKNYDNNYQYDGSSVYEYDEEDNGSLEANMFVADSNEYLKAVSFWTAQQNVSYSIQIYTGVVGTSNPTNGTAALKKEIAGVETYAGYHTIKLPSSVYLSAGERYSVVIRLSANNAEKTYFFVDKSDSSAEWIVFTNSGSAGQSLFCNATSNSWTDKGSRNINYRIKAFTDEAGNSNIDTSVDDSDSDYYYITSDDNSDSWWNNWFDDQSNTPEFSKVQDVSLLKDGDKIVLYNEATLSAVLPSMAEGRKDVLDMMKSEAYDFIDELLWTVRIENDNLYLESPDGMRMTAYDKNTVGLEKAGNTIEFKSNDNGSYYVYATGTQRYLKYNSTIRGFRFYKSTDKNAVFSIYKQAEKTAAQSKSRVIHYGDVTCDGEVTMLDVVAVQRLIANLGDDTTKALKMLADLDADGNVAMTDVVIMQKMIAGMATGSMRAGKTATFVMG
ncbi:MAG: hypothetical protein K6F76_05665 [Clostridiales bacterium]|nr:hypothetical protein [Clostridiales bacterium]